MAKVTIEEVIECDSVATFVSDVASAEELVSEISSFEGCEVCERYRNNDKKKAFHIQAFHAKQAVSQKLKDGKTVFSLPCRRGCMERWGMNINRSHFHCPFCGKTFGRRKSMMHHLTMNCSPQARSKHRAMLKKGPKGPNVSTPPPSRHYDHVIAIMEKRLSEWIQEQSMLGRTTNIETMEAKAKVLHEKASQDLGIRHATPFQAGKQWIRSFLQRFGLKGMSIVAPDLSKDQLALPAASQKDVVLNIISQVKMKPSLYDPLLATLEDQDEEKEAALWNEIAESAGLDSGDSAKKVWKNIEEKYYEQQKNKSGTAAEWIYWQHLQFLPSTMLPEPESEVIEDQPVEIANNCIEDVNLKLEPNMLTVSIESEDMDFETNLNDANEDCDDSFSKRVNIAMLKKIHLQMETIQKEHEATMKIKTDEHNARMELLKLEKEILMKKLS